MKDYRCKNCHKVLFKFNKHNIKIFLKEDKCMELFEIKCPKCKKVNQITYEAIDCLNNDDVGAFEILTAVLKT